MKKLALALAFSSLAAPAMAHPGHDEPRQRPEPVEKPAPVQRERSDAPQQRFGGGGASAPEVGGGGRVSRSIRAPHGGILVRAGGGYAELLADDAGNISVWWLDDSGNIRKPTTSLATVMSDTGAEAVVLKPTGDRAAGRLANRAGAKAVAVQAVIDGRTTTVRATLPTKQQ